jgi:hypothetical protein
LVGFVGFVDDECVGVVPVQLDAGIGLAGTPLPFAVNHLLNDVIKLSVADFLAGKYPELKAPIGTPPGLDQHFQIKALSATRRLEVLYLESHCKYFDYNIGKNNYFAYKIKRNLHRLYGTYLIHLIEVAMRSTEPCSVKQIAAKIHYYHNRREQANLESRVRRALKHMEEDQVVSREAKTGECNLIVYQYKLASNG